MQFGHIRSAFAVLAIVFAGKHAEARDVFSGPNGDLGANLSTAATDRSRMHAEISYFTTTSSATLPLVGTVSTTLHALTLTAGAGVRLNEHFELTFGLAGQGLLLSGNTNGNHYSIGNLSLGGNFIAGIGPAVRLKIGGAFALGPWNQEGNTLTPEGQVQAITGAAIHVYQDSWYYMPTHLHLYAPARLEFDLLDSLALTADATPDLAIGLNSNKTGVIFIFAPGLAYWPSEQVALGARIPIEINSLSTIANDSTQVAFEPFLRFDIGDAAFLATRFTMNLDNPAGFSFDSGKTWGWHVAVGGSF